MVRQGRRIVAEESEWQQKIDLMAYTDRTLNVASEKRNVFSTVQCRSHSSDRSCPEQTLHLKQRLHYVTNRRRRGCQEP